ncbi:MULTISPECIES: acetate--CoA ligase family protein [unclassified Methanoculleus]|uniref:acetate--CoA ligase family protein n=1 Tax=unclassified Methanoculleus TaxID=2619537 RepID=UPI0025D1E7B5|nr:MULTISPECIES: acetate--CoA ligase family protein [unclassified Methanoculleus]MCK9317249.1 acetate--CoA ligase family protein [Methanoculleus sp.]MDD2253170.1 acetate--CoA ligase family protein [Methanoculleus sp.]MDD2787094.1 acetate--CoA ligase family protein [Methanoculleus sp.]MDD3215809.1 acetate--CoA ligase family protein [Methanoculleus sp.]MDD4313755.1 acetate--CoA ligase family protein [Methanoculleus sp.]
MVKRMLSEFESYDLLKQYGVPVPEHAIVKTPAEAGKVAEKIGFPVVMKIHSPQIVHKSDAGGVIVSISSKQSAEEAFNKIVANAKAYNPDAEIKGAIVEQQAAPGLELIIGGKTDPAFGKVLTFGMGGTLVELMKDVTLRILPVTEETIREMIREINGYPIIKGYRGSKPRDEETLVQVIWAINRFFSENTNIVEFDINPVRLYESGACIVDARIFVDDEAVEKVAKERPFVPIEYFTPRSIAVIGASSEPKKMGYAVMHNLLHFPGQLYPVNNKRPEVQGLKAYTSILEIPNPVDMAVITVPAKHVPSVIEECGQKGVSMAIIITAGFKEMGEGGKALEERVLAIAKGYGTRIVGPNCLGLIVPPKGIDTTYVHESPKPGNIAFISQSGAIVNTVVDWSIRQDIGFSAVVSVGNQADLNFIDFLRFVERDPKTKGIILYIEEIQDGKTFMKVASEVAKTKPIVAIKSGSSEKGQAAASSHTGSLSGSYDVYMEAFRESGVIPVHTLTGTFQVAEMLSLPKGYPRGKRAVVITNAGGFAVLSSDYAERYGIDLITLPPKVLKELNEILPDFWNKNNPIDLLGDANEKRFEQVFSVLARHQDCWDIAFVVGFPNLVIGSEQLANQIIGFSGNTENMIVSTLLGGGSMDRGRKILRENGIPLFDELDFTFRVMGRILWQRFR